MDIKLSNITNVLLIILGLVGLLGALYLVFMINGLVVGTTSQVATSGDINVSSAMQTHLTGMESKYVTAAESLESRVGLAIQIFAVVIILALFGLGGYFTYTKLNKRGF